MLPVLACGIHYSVKSPGFRLRASYGSIGVKLSNVVEIFLAYSTNGFRLRHLGSIENIHLYISAISIFVFSVLMCSSSVFCILAGPGQRLLYRLGSGLGLVLVLRFCGYSYGGVYS